MAHLFDSPFFLLFGLIAGGLAIGLIRVRGMSLSAAGVFFLALLAGHYQKVVPPALTELGLVFFVYAVGLQSGSRFFRVLRTNGLAILSVGAGATLAGAMATLLLAWLVGLPGHLAAGLYSGSTTCTPALASVLEIVRLSQPKLADTTAVAYAVGYPFSVVAVVLVVQLAPRLFRTSVNAAERRFEQEQRQQANPLESCAFRITNPNCTEDTLEEFQKLKLSEAILCRVEHEGRAAPTRPETRLHLGDVVVAVGTKYELSKLEAVLGSAVPVPTLNPSGPVVSELIVVSRKTAFGQSLRELRIWERFGVSITRLRRGVTEMTPNGTTVLEPGDVLRVVGLREDVAAVIETLGREERRLDETSMVPFAAGIAIGAAVGLIPIPVPGGMTVRLGLAGGVFVVSLLLGYFGHVGPMRLYVPNAAKHFTRELGLLLFLAGAGSSAGQRLVPVLKEAGVALALAGACITLVTTFTALGVMALLLRWNMLQANGALSAVMTSPPGLAAAGEMTRCDAPQIGFASVYPVALLSKITLAPIIYLILSHPR